MLSHYLNLESFNIISTRFVVISKACSKSRAYSVLNSVRHDTVSRL